MTRLCALAIDVAYRAARAYGMGMGDRRGLSMRHTYANKAKERKTVVLAGGFIAARRGRDAEAEEILHALMRSAVFYPIVCGAAFGRRVRLKLISARQHA